MKDLFCLKVWAKNVGAHYRQQNMYMTPKPLLLTTQSNPCLAYYALLYNTVVCNSNSSYLDSTGKAAYLKKAHIFFIKQIINTNISYIEFA